MSRWDGFETFVHVVEQSGFSAAAEHMKVSKSFVSRQISKLEDRLGTQLLNRTTRKVTLTEVGAAFYARCKDLLLELEDAEQTVVEMQERPRGTLKVTVAGAFAENFIAPIAVEYMLKYPDIRTDIEFSDRNVDLVAEGYDLAIRSGVLKDSSLIARRITNRKLLICGSPDYLNEHGRPESISDLSHHNCLIGTKATWRFRENQRHFDLRVEGNWRSNNGRSLLVAAQKGLGLTQLPEFYFRDSLNNGGLETVLDEFQPTDTMFWAVYPSNRHLSAKVRLFIDFMIEQLNGSV